MNVDLEKLAKEKGIRYFLISFVDLFGVARAKLVPARAIGEMSEEGAGFAGFAAWLDMSPAFPDMLAKPDPGSFIQLPWNREVGWLAADLWMEGKEVEQAPRNVLRRLVRETDGKGYRLRCGVEAEYFLISPDGESIADSADTQPKPCYDQSALMRRYEVISQICDAMEELGWGPYQNDHEDANGQFEMNWDFDDALITADRHVFFKYMVKSIAERNGLRATFMPKPFSNLTGNGCHAHVSLWKSEANLFEDPGGELGISRTGYHFMGGLIAHAPALCALLNPCVNSYKRINALMTSSGATWSPNTITYGGNNRTHMIRIPGPGRFEVRLADGAVNPYLLPAGLLAAGMDGIENETSPGKRVDLDMYAEGHTLRGAKKLPSNLLDALRALEKDKILRGKLGDAATDAFLKLKHAEWDSYSQHLSSWERKTYLDC